MFNLKSLLTDNSKKRVYVIKLYGTIVENDESVLNKKFSAFDVVDELYDIAKEKTYDAILIRINSPGGAAAISEELSKAFLTVKNANIPVIVSISDLCASGAYLIATAANRIFANRMSLVGSIGAIIRMPNVASLIDKIGFKMLTFSSDKMKDMGNPTRNMTQEESDYFFDLVSTASQTFKQLVLERRNIKNIEKMTDGRIVDAQEALDNNLIDQIGTYNDAIKYIQKLLNTEDIDIYESKSKQSLIKRIFNF